MRTVYIIDFTVAGRLVIASYLGMEMYIDIITAAQLHMMLEREQIELIDLVRCGPFERGKPKDAYRDIQPPMGGSES